jgi:hypothetical protein
MLGGHGGVVIGSEMSGDVRNVTILEVRNALNPEIDKFSTRNPHPETPVILLEGVDGALIRDCTDPDGADPFLQLTGQENRGIRVSRPEFTDPIGDEKDRSGSQAIDS